MSLQKDASGRRSVQVEIEVPGTPEEVWEAIATGPGVSSWFVPVDVETDEQGNPVRIISHFGPGMDSVATPTAWDPPQRMAATSQDLGPNAPALATEWIVEARTGGTCVVRVVHSLFASTDDWDNQLESSEAGWPSFFRILRLYLMHFRGESCSAIRLMGMTAAPEAQAWAELTGSLGLAGIAAGERWQANTDAPPIAGTVEWIGGGVHRHEIARLDQPAPGIAFLHAAHMGGRTYLGFAFYLYGESGVAAFAREEPAWRAWMQTRFPFPAP